MQAQHTFVSSITRSSTSQLKSLLFTLVCLGFGAFTGSVHASQDQLLHAAKTGDLHACQSAVRNGARLDLAGPKGWTPLGIAIHQGYNALVAWMLNYRENPPTIESPISIETPPSEPQPTTAELKRKNFFSNKRKSSKNVIKPQISCLAVPSAPQTLEDTGSSPRPALNPLRGRSPNSNKNSKRDRESKRREESIESSQVCFAQTVAESLLTFRLPNGGTYLHIATAEGASDNPLMVELILNAVPRERRVDYVNALDENRNSPLLLAIRNGLTNIAMWLVRNGARIDGIRVAGPGTHFWRIHQLFLIDSEFHRIIEDSSNQNPVGEVGHLLSFLNPPTHNSGLSSPLPPPDRRPRIEVRDETDQSEPLLAPLESLQEAIGVLENFRVDDSQSIVEENPNNTVSEQASEQSEIDFALLNRALGGFGNMGSQ